jgi:hypothetical protein
MATKERVVVCAAIRNGGYEVICGPRHWDSTMRVAVALSGGQWKSAEQGFVDQFGQFMTRQEAWKVAEAAGQICYRVGGDERDGGTLYSENLY